MCYQLLGDGSKNKTSGCFENDLGKMEFVFDGCVMHFIDHCVTEFFPSIVRTLSSCLFALRRSSCFQSHPLINDHTEQHTNGILNSNTYKSKLYTYVLFFIMYMTQPLKTNSIFHQVILKKSLSLVFRALTQQMIAHSIPEIKY